ncbi:multiheme c-type cytochrome [Desulfoplanes sp.]
MIVALCGAGGVVAGDYMGTTSCAECHEQEYSNFMKYSKKAHSWKGVEKMLPKLEPAERKTCFRCHTTGYKKGGFVSYEKTPEFADVGCETCHGPGKDHVESGGDPVLIIPSPTIDSCTQCHNSQRVKDFNYKPLLHSGAH